MDAGDKNHNNSEPIGDTEPKANGADGTPGAAENPPTEAVPAPQVPETSGPADEAAQGTEETAGNFPDAGPQPSDGTPATAREQPGEPSSQMAPKPGENVPEPAEKELSEEEEERLEKKRGCIRLLITMAVILVVSGAIAFTAITAIGDMMGLNKPDKTVVVQIPHGATSDTVANVLKSDGVIRSKLVFRLYLKYVAHGSFQYGEFQVNSDMAYADIISTITNNSNNLAIVSVTIPEGYSLDKIASLLETKKICSASAFIKSCQNDSFTFSYMTPEMSSSKRLYKLEGYLFPDTYKFYKGSEPKKVVQTMLDTFAGRFGSSLAQQAKARKMTVDQAVTLASIIQAEASDTSEMATVSSVFHNRLENGTGSLKYLQSDATIFYITRVVEPALGKTDLAKTSPYNTYRNPGLTPGPICSPGLAALKAAVSPADTDYYYFVTDSDNTYYYAATFAQHERNIAKANRVGTVQSGTGTTNG